MTHDRLEAFRSAYQNLQLLPLIKPEDLRRFRVEYGTETIEDLEQLIEDCPPGNNKIIFTGHRGCGKSTLLSQLRQRLDDRYFIVFFSISDLIEMSDVNHVNILFAIAVQLMEAAEERHIKIGEKTKKQFYDWFSRHTKAEIANVEASVDTESYTEAGFNAWFAKFFAKIKATLKANAVIRQEIFTEFARRISDLVDRINDIAAAIQVSANCEILVIIDDLDKLDWEIADRIFRQNISALFQPQFRIIYTIPMAATRDMSLRGIIRTASNTKIQYMWATKFFPRGADRSADTVPNPDAVAMFRQILLKRMDENLLEPEVIEPLILKSGGVLRELIRLSSQCCTHALVRLRRDRNQPDLRIDDAILQQAIKDLRLEFTEPLGQDHYAILQQTYTHFAPQDTADQKFLDLLHNLHILEYRNDDLWFGVHPVVRDLLERRGLVA